MSSPKPVVVSVHDLEQGIISSDTLDAAFGPDSLGIILVKDLPTVFTELRLRLLQQASYLAHLPPRVLDQLVCPSAKFLVGWSCGVEKLKPGIADTSKGSFYVNCAEFSQNNATPPPQPTSSSSDSPDTTSDDFPEYTASNVWPPQDAIPGFQQTFDQLCSLIITTAALVARACDIYARDHIDDYRPHYLEHIVRSSTTTKARLLHYFPADNIKTADGASIEAVINPDEQTPSDTVSGSQDDWCATHVDHGCLTGLTAALYVDESSTLPPPSPTSTTSPALKTVPSPPDPKAGLYIRARNGITTQVRIPVDHLAFQTGEALERVTNGRFRAVPHFVRAGRGSAMAGIARNTLAVFTQPNLNEVIDPRTGQTFRNFSAEVMQRHQ